MSAIHFSSVSFAYSSAVPILENASFDLGPGWTGLVGANGAGKSTLLALVAGDLEPTLGVVTTEPKGRSPVVCQQRVDDLTDTITEFARSWRRESVRMRAMLDLVADDLDRWGTLSPGERKRWQVGAALAAEPDVLLLDEPTNHLDAEARSLLVAALHRYSGCGIVVSHDRGVLNDLTTRTLWVGGGAVDLWNGSYDVASNARAADQTERTARFEAMRADRKKLARRIDEQRRTSVQKDADRIRERRAAGKHDLDTRGSAATYKHERGQKTGAQSVSSMTNSLDRLDQDLASMSMTKDRGGAISFDFAPADKEFLIRYDGEVRAGASTLFDVDLAVRRSNRIRIEGANGAGKTSLVAAVMKGCAIAESLVLNLPQEVTASEARTWLESVRSLPPAEKGRVMSLVALLGADPASLLASDQPSPGEARKVALALGLGTPKWLLVLDEPTNHLDLPSIERLEAALTAYQGAILLITHDDQLAESVTETTWSVGPEGVSIEY